MTLTLIILYKNILRIYHTLAGYAATACVSWETGMIIYVYAIIVHIFVFIEVIILLWLHT